jgi:limonene 1,2-monooxygenase
MMGIEPHTQRPRMEEALGVILRLFREEEPFTYESDWFVLRDARLQIRPYSRPHMPVAVAAVQSPAGMVAAGKHGIGVLSFSIPRSGGGLSAVKEFWEIAETTAREHGQTVSRDEWRVVMHVHLTEDREEAMRQARHAAGRYQREYYEYTLGAVPPIDGPAGDIAPHMMEQHLWCIGTPDDLIARIDELLDGTGGFGGLMVQATEWASREQVFHSYELLARYVMPRYQGLTKGLFAANDWYRDKQQEFEALRLKAMDRAKQDYAGRTSPAGR